MENICSIPVTGDQYPETPESKISNSYVTLT